MQIKLEEDSALEEMEVLIRCPGRTAKPKGCWPCCGLWTGGS